MKTLEAALAALSAAMVSDPLALLARENARSAAMALRVGEGVGRSVKPRIVKRVLGGAAAKKPARASRKKGARS